MPVLEHVEINQTELLRHNELVKLNCDKPYKVEGEPIRKCQYGKLEPNFQKAPFKCLPREFYTFYLVKLLQILKTFLLSLC